MVAGQAPHATSAQLDPVLSRKIKVLVWFAITLVLWVHAFNAYPRFLVPNTLVQGDFNPFNYLQYLLSNGLARFVMPLFFVVSGYLFFVHVDRATHFGQKISKRLRTVLLPYVIWNCVGIALVVAARNISWLREFMPQYLRDMTPRSFASDFFLHPVSFQLWYLRDLFVLTLLSPLIYFICKRPAGAVLWLALLVAVWSQEIVGPPLLTAEGTLFFSIGAIAALHQLTPQRKVDVGVWLLVASAWLGLNALRAWMAFGPFPGAETWVLILYKLCMPVGLWTVWHGYDHIIGDVQQESRWWSWIGVSFYIFAAHQPLYNILSDNILARIGHHEALKSVNPGGAFVVYLMLPIATIIALSVLGMTLRSKAPRAHRLLTGGR